MLTGFFSDREAAGRRTSVKATCRNAPLEFCGTWGRPR